MSTAIGNKFLSSCDRLYHITEYRNESSTVFNDLLNLDDKPWLPKEFETSNSPSPNVKYMISSLGLKNPRNIGRGSMGEVFSVESARGSVPTDITCSELFVDRNPTLDGTPYTRFAIKVSQCKSHRDAIRAHSEWVLSSLPELHESLRISKVVFPTPIFYKCIRCPNGFVWNVMGMSIIDGDPLVKVSKYPQFGLPGFLKLEHTLYSMVKNMMDVGLVLGDLSHNNVLTSCTGDVVGVLDFETLAVRRFTSGKFPDKVEDLGVSTKGRICPTSLLSAASDCIEFYVKDHIRPYPIVRQEIVVS